MLADTEKAAHANNRIGHPTLPRDDEILDDANFFLVVVVNWFAQDIS